VGGYENEAAGRFDRPDRCARPALDTFLEIELSAFHRRLASLDQESAGPVIPP
jgi:hypothetical protein